MWLEKKVFVFCWCLNSIFCLRWSFIIKKAKILVHLLTTYAPIPLHDEHFSKKDPKFTHHEMHTFIPGVSFFSFLCHSWRNYSIIVAQKNPLDLAAVTYWANYVIYVPLRWPLNTRLCTLARNTFLLPSRSLYTIRRVFVSAC